MERVFNQKMGEMGKERGWCGVDSWVYGELKREGKRRGTLVVEMPSYTILCFTRVLDFSHFLDFSRIFMKNQKSKIKNPKARKTQEDLSTLHYALGKNASLLRFSRVFAHNPYQIAIPMHTVIWA